VGSGRAGAGSAPRPGRKRATKGTRRSLLVPTEVALIWGLLYDLLCLPVWLVGLVLGRARLSDGMRPLDRLLRFVLSARMTALLIGLNLLVFAVEIYTRHAGWSRAAFVAHFTLSTDGLGRGEQLPLLTHFFSHASLMHLGGNMLALFVFGRVVERNLGPWRLLTCYLLAAVCATALSLLVQGLSGRSVPTLGASGAVAGLVALGILLEPLAITFEALLPMPLFLVGWLAIAADFGALLSGTPDPVDHPAHLGGYLSVLLGYYALKRQQKEQARLGLLVNLATLLLMAGLWFFWGSRAG
jgi:membrane associated rhomboid family serine protease